MFEFKSVSGIRIEEIVSIAFAPAKWFCHATKSTVINGSTINILSFTRMYSTNDFNNTIYEMIWNALDVERLRGGGQNDRNTHANAGWMSKIEMIRISMGRLVCACELHFVRMHIVGYLHSQCHPIFYRRSKYCWTMSWTQNTRQRATFIFDTQLTMKNIVE